MAGILSRGLQQGLHLTWTLGKIIFPITLIVTILQYTSVLDWVVEQISPLMRLLGLPGEAAVPLVLGNALNLYAGIGAIVSFDFSVKEVFILAMMMSFSHNLFIESAVASKAGVRWWLILGIRLSLAFIAAIMTNFLWQGGSEMAHYGMMQSSDASLNGGWTDILLYGLKTAFTAVMQLALIVMVLMVIMQFFREKGWLTLISDKLAPFTRMLGMGQNTSMTLVAGLTLGLAYGAGLMIQAVKEEGVSKRDIYLALIFLVACHAVVEDTVIFIPLGIPVWPLLLIRLATAVVLTITAAFIWRRITYRGSRNAAYEQSNLPL